MGIILSSLFRFAVSFGAGIGLTSLIDKFFPDKLPTSVAPVTPTGLRDPVTGKFNFMKIIFFIFVVSIGAMLLKFIAGKLKIKLLK